MARSRGFRISAPPTTLRVILLQDPVILRQQFPLHPLWKDPLFNCEAYRRFAARVESSLVNVVTPEELAMQKYWPTQEAVAKLGHEAAISEIKKSVEIVRSNSEIVQSMSDRLDKMERSSVSTLPASYGSLGSGLSRPHLYVRLGLFRFLFLRPQLRLRRRLT